MKYLVWLLLAACGGSDGDSGPRPKTFGGDRPVDLRGPTTIDEDREYPLVLVLHGYGANGFVQVNYFGLPQLATNGDALVIAPDGITDASGKQFWNADPACCDFGGKNPDDVGYLGRLIEDVSAAYPVDRKRVFVIGHSNGSFMAYRMACERPDLVTAIAGLAGAAASMPASCTPERAVNVLHIHGTADDVVPFSAGGLGVGAEASVQQWATHGGCGTTLADTGATYDLEASLAGSETRALAAPCPAGTAVELWRVEGGSHVPTWGPTFTPTMWQWLLDHPRT